MVNVVTSGTSARKNLGTQAISVEPIKGLGSGMQSFKRLQASGSKPFDVLRSTVVSQ